MSRIGKKPIDIPNEVKFNIKGQLITVQGPKGELSYNVHSHIKINQQGSQLFLSIDDVNNKQDKALWGTNRQLVANLFIGVTKGYTKQLEVNGVGYRAEVKGNDLILKVGFSHPVNFRIPSGVNIKVEKNVITLESIDKQLLGETAANIRRIKKPEPYKGKGIKYVDEVILRKAGKQVKGAGE